MTAIEEAISIYDNFVKLDEQIRHLWFSKETETSATAVAYMNVWQDNFNKWFIEQFAGLYGQNTELDKRLDESSWCLIPDSIKFSHPKFVALRDKAIDECRMKSGYDFWESENEEIARNRAKDLVKEFCLFEDITDINKQALIQKIATAIKKGLG